MHAKFDQGDIVRVTTGPSTGREGTIYDGIGIPKHDPWVRADETGRPEYRVYFDLMRGVDAGWYAEDSLTIVKAMPEPVFHTGDRVRIGTTAYWAQGDSGTVNAGGWDASLAPQIKHRGGGPTRVHVVHLDHPRDDGSGDGPYIAGTFAESELEPLLDRLDRPRAYPAARLKSEGEAIRQLMENPELGQPVIRIRPPERES